MRSHLGLGDLSACEANIPAIIHDMERCDEDVIPKITTQLVIWLVLFLIFSASGWQDTQEHPLIPRNHDELQDQRMDSESPHRRRGQEKSPTVIF